MCYLSHAAHKVHGWLTIDELMTSHTQVCFACRPDYKKLGVLKQQFPDVPILALTATATQRVREVHKAPLLRQDSTYVCMILFRSLTRICTSGR